MSDDAGEAARRILNRPSGYYSMDPAPRIVAAAYLDANDQIMRLVAEIERLRGARGWQLIESAPRDGSLIDLWMRSYFWTADGDKQLSVQQRVPEAIWFNGQWTNSDGNPHGYLDGFTDYELSHWMPLPSPPAGE